MKKTPKKKKPISAERIAFMAGQGKDISRFFTNRLGMVDPARRIAVEFSGPMLGEIDAVSKKLEISSEAFIKTLVREGLDLRRKAAIRPEVMRQFRRSVEQNRKLYERLAK